MEDLTRLLDVEIEKLMNSLESQEIHPTIKNALKTEYQNEIGKRQLSRTLAFDSRNEVSADARYIADHIAGRIVKHLWIIFILLPVVGFVLLSLTK